MTLDTRTSLDSPALMHQSIHYPARFGGLVPKKIRMVETARAEIPFSSPKLAAYSGRELECWVNAHGAVAAIIPEAGLLGVVTGEFEVIEWHEEAHP